VAEITLAPFLQDLEQSQVRRVNTLTEYSEIRNILVQHWQLSDLKQYDTASNLSNLMFKEEVL